MLLARLRDARAVSINSTMSDGGDRSVAIETTPALHDTVAQVVAELLDHTTDGRLRCDQPGSMAKILNRVNQHPKMGGS